MLDSTDDIPSYIDSLAIPNEFIPRNLLPQAI